MPLYPNNTTGTWNNESRYSDILKEIAVLFGYELSWYLPEDYRKQEEENAKRIIAEWLKGLSPYYRFRYRFTTDHWPPFKLYINQAINELRGIMQ